MYMKGGGQMIKSIKIRLKPTQEQEVLMWKSVGITRFAYNWGLARWIELYESDEKVNKGILRTEFNQYKKQFDWIKEVSGQVTADSFEQLDVAFKNFFQKKAGYPKFKSKKKSKPSFYVRYDAIKFNNNTVQIEKIGKVKFSSNYEVPQLDKYVNPRASFDGKYWYLSLGFEQEKPCLELTDEVVGIDLGVSNLAIVSNTKEPIKNINKSKKVKQLKKKLKRKQRKISKKYEMNKQGNKFIKTQNIIKAEKEVKLLHRQLHNIRFNHIHQATSMIVKTKPSRVVMEDLNISGMMKNRHLAKVIQEQCWYEFIRQMKYKCEWSGIDFIQVPRFYPSSKTCSECGCIKSDLKLSDRVYRCNECGFEIDRDLNAAINLANYKSA